MANLFRLVDRLIIPSNNSKKRLSEEIRIQVRLINYFVCSTYLHVFFTSYNNETEEQKQQCQYQRDRRQLDRSVFN